MLLAAVIFEITVPEVTLGSVAVEVDDVTLVPEAEVEDVVELVDSEASVMFQYAEVCWFPSGSVLSRSQKKKTFISASWRS